MASIIDTLREEHRDIEKLLIVLERELDVFDHSESPDYQVLQSVIDYFEEFPERCHHPKEDLVFALVKERAPSAAEMIGNLEAEHREGSQRLRRFKQMVASILTDHEVPRETFDAVLRDFIDRERAHIEVEEQVFFPIAIKTLRPEDWVRIDALQEVGKTPLNEAAGRRFHRMQAQIASWEDENEAARA
jgi:hemerythrin-like domain-containing protein